MVWSIQHSAAGGAVWRLAEAQHGVVARRQLLELGYSSRSIEHRIATARLHPVMHGIYAVGSRRLTQRGVWMAAVLSCGPDSLLSHTSAAALWGFGSERAERVELTVRTGSARRRPGLRISRRPQLEELDVTAYDGVPTTGPVRTLVDLASLLGPTRLERCVNEAVRLDLTDPEALRTALARYRGIRGVARLRALLDHRTFRLTASELERRFASLALATGLPPAETGRLLNGFEVDFYWPSLGLVVETDGLRYHRTPAQQSRDRLRDQVHTAAGLTTLRFTHSQIVFDPTHVKSILQRTITRLGVE